MPSTRKENREEFCCDCCGCPMEPSDRVWELDYHGQTLHICGNCVAKMDSNVVYVEDEEEDDSWDDGWF